MDGPEVGPRVVRQHAEDAVEVEAMRLNHSTRHHRQAQVGVVDRDERVVRIVDDADDRLKPVPTIARSDVKRDETVQSLECVDVGVFALGVFPIRTLEVLEDLADVVVGELDRAGLAVHELAPFTEDLLDDGKSADVVALGADRDVVGVKHLPVVRDLAQVRET